MKSSVILLIGCLCYTVEGLYLSLEPNTHKCLRDEMQAHQLVVGEYEISAAPGQTVDYEVR